MDHYDTYRSNAAEAPIMRRWVFGALVMSLLFHVGLFFFLYGHKLRNFGPAEVPRLAPPQFMVKKVYIDPKTVEEPEEVRVRSEAKTPAPVSIEIPADKPEVEEVRAAPQIGEIASQLLNEKPKVESSGLENLNRANALSRGDMEKELDSLAGSLLKEGPKSPRQPLIMVAPGKSQGAGGADAAEGIPGLKSLDDALAQTGPLPAGDKPIGMPGGALFEYDKYDLRPEALDQLRKLAALIERNPRATFSIEGHTDSFGSPEYNLRLSEMRAESVKLWLVEIMKIAPERIQTRGYGNTKPLVPSTKSMEEQAPNRRVEIVVKTNRK